MKIKRSLHWKTNWRNTLLGFYYLVVTAQGLVVPASIVFRQVENLPVQSWEYFLSGALFVASIYLIGLGAYASKAVPLHDPQKIINAIENYQAISQEVNYLQERTFKIRDGRFKSSYLLRGIDTYENLQDYSIMQPGNMPPIRWGLEFNQSYQPYNPELLDQESESAAERISFWTKALIYETERTFIARNGFDRKDISFGFQLVSEHPHFFNEEDYHFGVIVHLDPEDPMFATEDFEKYDNNFRRNFSKRVVDIVELGRLRVPVFLNKVRKTPHCGDPQPSLGTRTCVAESTIPAQGLGLGFLTAKHVTGSVVGGTVPLSCGHLGYVAGLAREGIDTAFVICPECTMTAKEQIVTKRAVAPWTKVIIHAEAGPIYTIIVATNDMAGLYDQYQIPIHHLLATAGLPGDSGALITDQDTGEAVSVYLGGITDAANRPGGFAIHAHQVSQVMRLNFYH